MAKAVGRLAILAKAGTTIGGVRVTTVKWAGEVIDVSDNDSGSVVELLATLGSEQITLSVEGVYKDPVLRTIALTPATSKLLTDLTFKFSDSAGAASDTISGSFMLSSYEEGNPYKEATTFSCEIMSTGTWTIG